MEIKTVMCENGDTFNVSIREAIERIPGRKYIFIDGSLFEVLSKEKTNTITVTDEMSNMVRPK